MHTKYGHLTECLFLLFDICWPIKRKQTKKKRFKITLNTPHMLPMRNQLVISILFKWSATESFIVFVCLLTNNNNIRMLEKKMVIKMIMLSFSLVHLILPFACVDCNINNFVFFCGMWCHLNRPTPLSEP